LNGQELIDALVENYKTTEVLSYNNARDTLYARIDNSNDTVYAVYTHFSKYLPPGVDPTQSLFNGGAEDAINTEHTWPRSKGAQDGTLGHSDMHHLFATRMNVNGLRANDPFKEINDSQTNRWFYLDMEMNNIPSNDIDDYSEWTSGVFEPREDHKGNVARAMMYFYTMYRDNVDNSDPQYFEIQREDLCFWHYFDPADDSETLRNEKIAFYQGGKINPFIEDCTLAGRTYCPEFADECISNTKEIENSDLNWDVKLIDNYLVFTAQEDDPQEILTVRLTDVLGREHLLQGNTNINSTNTLQIDSNLIPGAFFVTLFFEGGRYSTIRLIHQ
jgi:endonuclease I